MMERLNFKTLRFDAIADSVIIDGKFSKVEISRDAFEALSNRPLNDDEIVQKAVEEAKRLNHLVNIIPADDGKINITAALMMSEGKFDALYSNSDGE